MLIKIHNTRSSDYSLPYVTKNVIDQMVTLNDLSNSWGEEVVMILLFLFVIPFTLIHSPLIIVHILILIIIFVLFIFLILIICLGRRSVFI
jgi:hypothetical protein